MSNSWRTDKLVMQAIRIKKKHVGHQITAVTMPMHRIVTGRSLGLKRRVNLSLKKSFGKTYSIWDILRFFDDNLWEVFCGPSAQLINGLAASFSSLSTGQSMFEIKFCLSALSTLCLPFCADGMRNYA
jgi:hypothetical protein